MERFVNLRAVFIVSFLFFNSIFFLGCASTPHSLYIQDHNPYKQDYFADFNATLSAVEQVLKNEGWVISSKVDPVEYEQPASDIKPEAKQWLMLTQSRTGIKFLSNGSMNLNIYVRELTNATQVEIRYIKWTNLGFKQLKSYKNKRYVDRLFESINRLLEQHST